MQKTKLLAYKSIYWPGINSNVEKYMKNFSTCLESQQMQPKKLIMHHKIPAKPRELVGADISTLHNTNYICIVDHHSKYPRIKKMEDLLADILILACKIIFHNMAYEEK